MEPPQPCVHALLQPAAPAHALVQSVARKASALLPPLNSAHWQAPGCRDRSVRQSPRLALMSSRWQRIGWQPGSRAFTRSRHSWCHAALPTAVGEALLPAMISGQSNVLLRYLLQSKWYSRQPATVPNAWSPLLTVYRIQCGATGLLLCMWLHCCSSRGWGLVAAEPIKQGQQLVAVPQRATMSALSAASCPVVGSVAAVGGLNDWQVQHESLFIAARLLTKDHASAGARPCLGPGCAILPRVLPSAHESAGVSQRLH